MTSAQAGVNVSAGASIRKLIMGAGVKLERGEREYKKFSDIILAWTPIIYSASRLEVLVQIFCSHIRMIPLKLSGCSYGSPNMYPHSRVSNAISAASYIFIHLFAAFSRFSIGIPIPYCLTL